jgi:Homeodomain-like domain
MSGMPADARATEPQLSPGRDPDSLFRDPIATLQRALDLEAARVEARRGELAEVRTALLQLASSSATAPDGQAAPVWEPVAADMAPALIEHLLDSVEGTLRSSILTLAEGPGLDEATIRGAQARIAQGWAQRALYPMQVLDTDHGRQWVRSWADVGEQQRLTTAPPSDFAIFGETAVMAVAEWGNAASDYVLVRDPMLVQAFIALFDRAFDRALPVPEPHGRAEADPRLLRLMAVGLKDETIARYLGCSLRTVRRRVARLMEEHGAETRFQLGAALARDGLVEPPRIRA